MAFRIALQVATQRLVQLRASATGPLGVRGMASVAVTKGPRLHLSTSNGESYGGLPVPSAQLDLSDVTDIYSFKKQNMDDFVLLVLAGGKPYPFPSSSSGFESLVTLLKNQVNISVVDSSIPAWFTRREAKSSMHDASHAAIGMDGLGRLLEVGGVWPLAAIESAINGSESETAKEELTMVRDFMPKLLRNVSPDGSEAAASASRVAVALGKCPTCAPRVAEQAASLLDAILSLIGSQLSNEKAKDCARNLAASLASVTVRLDSRDRLHDKQLVGRLCKAAHQMAKVEGVPQLATLAAVSIMGTAMDVRNHLALLQNGVFETLSTITFSPLCGLAERRVVAQTLQMLFENQEDGQREHLDGPSALDILKSLVTNASGDVTVEKSAAAVLLNLCVDEGMADEDRLYEMILDNANLDFLILSLQSSGDKNVRQAISTVKEVYESLARVHAPLSVDGPDSRKASRE